MKITWYGHSCFLIEENEYKIVLDPYDPKMLPWYKNLSLVANEVICSHTHGDHSYKEAVKIPKIYVPNPFTIEVINTYHDNMKGKLRGSNNITILKANGYKIAHLGDLGCSLSAEELAKLKNLDCLMIPIGGYYTISAQEALDLISKVNPRVVIPMHYRTDIGGFDVLENIDSFKNSSKNIINIEDNELVLDKNISGTIILNDSLLKR